MKKLYKICSLSITFSLLFGLLYLNAAYGDFATEYSINPDGSVTPSTPLITKTGNTYYLTGDLMGFFDVHASNIIFDGNGHTLHGPGNLGFYLDTVNNVTIRNFTITGFNEAIYSYNSSYNHICGNILLSNAGDGIEFLYDSNHNFIYDNKITANGNGILLSSSLNPPDGNLPGSNYNEIYSNKIQSNGNDGILLWYSYNSKVYNNTITDNGYCGICLSSSSDNEFHLNNLVNNPTNAKVGGAVGYWSTAGIGGPGANIWDNGSVGNYWGDYNGSDKNHDGLGETPYVVDSLNSDKFPLMEPIEDFYTLPFTPPRITLLSPVAQRYNESSIDLAFSIDKFAVWMGYSLDGQGNMTITGNCTIANMANGVHTITVYANDTFGNRGESGTVTFIVVKPESTSQPEPFLTSPVVAVFAAVMAVVAVGVMVYWKKRKR